MFSNKKMEEKWISVEAVDTKPEASQNKLLCWTKPELSQTNCYIGQNQNYPKQIVTLDN